MIAITNSFSMQQNQFPSRGYSHYRDVCAVTTRLSNDIYLGIQQVVMKRPKKLTSMFRRLQRPEMYQLNKLYN